MHLSLQWEVDIMETVLPLILEMLEGLLMTVECLQLCKQQEKEVLSLQKDYDKLSDQTKERKDLAKKLKDDAFAEKYARAKYYYSREGESIYPVPSLLP